MSADSVVPFDWRQNMDEVLGPITTSKAVQAAKEAAYARMRGEQLARQQIEEEQVLADPRLMEALQFQMLCDVPRASEIKYRVQGLILANAVSLLWAQAKTGKTTFLVNYMKALTVPGTKFLGAYDVVPVGEGRTVGFLNYEMDRELFAVWADQHGVDDSRVAVWNLRGMPNPLKTRATRQKLIEELKQAKVEVLIIDTYSRAMLSDNEQDNPAATDWFKVLGEITGEAGITDVLVTHHAGHNGERVRGASALRDNPDCLLGLTKDENDQRFLESEGRQDDKLEQTELHFDPTTRTLTLGDVTKAAAKAQDKADKELADHLMLQSQAKALADVLTEEKVSQSHAFDQVDLKHGLKVHNTKRAKVVAYAQEHFEVQVGGAGGPGSGRAKYLWKVATP